MTETAACSSTPRLDALHVAPHAPAVIQIEGVCKQYGDTVAVDHIDLEVAEQSLLGLVGPNGAGKTTTLKMLATMIKPDAGRITVRGHDLDEDVQQIRRTIGYMPDAFGSFRGLTCEQYLEFFGRCYGLSGAELQARTDEVLALTDLTQLRDQLTSGLSTGLKQRLSLAKTLIHDPAILLLDEPASGLDPRARIEIRMFLKELANMGKTIVISSHILADLEEICTDIAIIEHGRVVWQGDRAAMRQAIATEGTHLEIEVPEAATTAARETLAGLPEVLFTEESNGTLQLELRGEDSNAVLRALVERDIQVVHFSRRGSSLEKLFLSHTKGLGA